jgi:heme/copper-type cytochrome/quinol oxidase subunit 2
MPVVVEVKSQQDFDAWLASQKSAMQASSAPPAKVAQAAQNTDEPTALRVATAE